MESNQKIKKPNTTELHIQNLQKTNQPQPQPQPTTTPTNQPPSKTSDGSIPN